MTWRRVTATARFLGFSNRDHALAASSCRVLPQDTLGPMCIGKQAGVDIYLVPVTAGLAAARAISFRIALCTSHIPTQT